MNTTEKTAEQLFSEAVKARLEENVQYAKPLAQVAHWVTFPVNLGDLVKKYRPSKAKEKEDNYWIGTPMWNALHSIDIQFNQMDCSLQFTQAGRYYDFFGVTVTVYFAKTSD